MVPDDKSGQGHSVESGDDLFFLPPLTSAVKQIQESLFSARDAFSKILSENDIVSLAGQKEKARLDKSRSRSFGSQKSQPSSPISTDTSILFKDVDEQPAKDQQPVNALQVTWQRVVQSVQTTLHGSSKDIGWLGMQPGLLPVKDQTKRFDTVLEEVKKGVHSLPSKFVYLLVPGLFSNLSPLYLRDTKNHFIAAGVECHIAKVHSEASVETNAQELRDFINKLHRESRRKVFVLGHSKGGIDTAAAISLYEDDLLNKVAGLVVMQCPYGGSPVASDLLRDGQLANSQIKSAIQLLMDKLLKGDIRCLEDLTYAKRKEFLALHPLPRCVPCLSYHTETSKSPAALFTFSNILQAEVPWVPQLSPGKDNSAEQNLVEIALPLSGALSSLALHLELRYGATGDGLVLRRDAEIPGSIVVRHERRLDHGFIVFPPVWKDDKEATAPQICEALVTLLVENMEKKQD